MNRSRPPPVFTEDQRKKLITELSSEGVTQPAAIARWKLVIVALIKVFIVILVWVYALKFVGEFLESFSDALFVLFRSFGLSDDGRRHHRRERTRSRFDLYNPSATDCGGWKDRPIGTLFAAVHLVRL